MRPILIWLGGAAAVIIAALFAAPALVPASNVKSELAAYVKQATGRQLVIAGDGQFRILPSTGVTFERIALSGPDGNPQQPFLRAETVTAELSLLSLLSGTVNFDAVTLDSAVIDLRTNADGSVNWEFASAEGAGTLPPPTRRAALAGPAAAAPTRVGIQQVRLRDSTINYHAPDASGPVSITDSDLTLLMPDPESEANLTGAFSANGKRIEVDATLTTPQRLTLGERAQLVATLSGGFGVLRFDGDVMPDTVVKGALTAESEEPSDVFALAGASAAPALASVTLQASLEAGEDNIRLSDLRATLDDMTATGNLAVAMRAERPRLSGQLDFDELALDALAMQPLPKDAANAAGDGLWTAHAAPDDDMRLDLDGLDLIDADLALSAGTVTRKALTASNAEARARLNNGALNIELSNLSLYEGNATGRFELTGHDGIPVVSAMMDMQQVDALPLFTNASSFDWLSGTLDGRINVASGGKTVKDLRARLQGDANMRLTQGALRGLDLPAILARLQSGELSEFRRREGETTRFAELDASWTVNKGVARTDDLRLKGPFVSARGTGKVDVRRERLDFKLRPRVAPRASENQTAEAIELPIRIEGGWEKPRIYPDVEEVLKDPEKSLGAAKNFGKTVEELTGGDVSEDDFKNAIEGLLGNN